MKEIRQKKYNLLQNIVYVYNGVARHKPYLIVLLALSIICVAGNKFIWLFLSKYVIEYIDQGMQSFELIKMVVTLTIIGMLFIIGQTIVNCWKEPAAYYIRPMFMLERNKKYFLMNYEGLEHKEVLDSLQKSINSTQWPQNGVEGLILNTIIGGNDVITCITAMVILSFSSPIMIAFVLIFGLISYISIDKASKNEKRLTKDEVTYDSRKQTYFLKVCRDFSYGKDIRLFGAKGKLLETQSKLNKTIHSKVCKARNYWIKSGVFVNTLEMLREGIMYVYLVYLILRGELGIAEFTLYIGCVRNFAQTFQNLIKVYSDMRQCSREVNDFRTFDEYCDIQNELGIDVPKAEKYCIRFENVSFKYPSSDHYALRNFSFVIDQGMKLAVVGLNGAGKTTFVKLMLRLYEPTEGAIYLNDVDISTIDRKKYFSLYAPVFQDLECFAFTLAENVSLEVEKRIDKKRAEECLRKAGLGDRLDEWKNGIETNIQKVLYNDGIILSGGEKQKMGVARALYKKAFFLILDEPTAALDAMAESKMYQEFDELVKGKTSVYISHRLASTRFCDIIAVFKGGKLIETGSHDELMNKSGEYAKMYEMQAHYYSENVSLS